MKNKPKRKPRTAKTEVYPYPSQDTLKMQELKEELDNIEIVDEDSNVSEQGGQLWLRVN